jgi:uncharacterized membrane protein
VEAYISDWLNLLVRWLHMIAGIAWIGSSFYFVWLDNHLQPPKADADRDKGVGGELWSVHGGGFYHWLGAGVYLIDPSVASLTPQAATAISLVFIVAGWLVYDSLCKSRLAGNGGLFAGILLLLAALLAWGLCQLFGGRGAYIHFGAVLGTIMAANVFFVIIPGQRQMVAAAERGEAPDPLPGIRGKQRSVHNTYFTLPVLFTMISNHFAMTYSHEFNWAILIAISLAGALVRVYFVARHSGRASPLPIVAAVVLLLIVAVAIAPRDTAASVDRVDFGAVREVVHERCTANPSPNGGDARHAYRQPDEHN